MLQKMHADFKAHWWYDDYEKLRNNVGTCSSNHLFLSLNRKCAYVMWCVHMISSSYSMQLSEHYLKDGFIYPPFPVSDDEESSNLNKNILRHLNWY